MSWVTPWRDSEFLSSNTQDFIEVVWAPPCWKPSIIPEL